MEITSSLIFLLRIFGSLAIGNLLTTSFSSIKKPTLFTTNICIGLAINVLFFYWLLPLENFKNEILNSIQLIALIHFILKKGFQKIQFLPKIKENNPRYKFFLICLAIAVIYILTLNFFKPHGSWDAFSMWNLKANFLSNGINFWSGQNADLIKYTHLDYPLFLPSAVAFLNFHLLPQLAPIFLSFLFTIGTTLLFVDPTFTSLSLSKRITASLVLLVNLSFLKYGSNQYADVPLAFFLLAAIMTLVKAKEFNNVKLYLIAGVFIGAMLWMKNEGTLYMVLLVLSTIMCAMLYKNAFKISKKAMLLFIGILPFLITLVHFKVSVVVTNDLLVNSSTEILKKLTEPKRYLLILSRFIETLFNLSATAFQPIILFIFAVAIVSFSKLISLEKLNALKWIRWFLIFSIVAFFGIYLITPQNLEWHLNTSVVRLFMQLLPVFVLFAIMYLPEFLFKKLKILEKQALMEKSS